MPDAVQRLVGLGAQVAVEAGLGGSVSISDEVYQKAGAQISDDRQGALRSSDVVLRVRKPPLNEIGLLKSGCIHVSLLDAFNERDIVRALAASGVSAIGLEMIPRITVAQKMDALSSQANLAGYVAVILAAFTIDRSIPMMMTPAGTIKPLRVFVIGAGVAGLQAIATAKRLGARVEAFDTRPVVEEQVHSLGAKFVKIDLANWSDGPGLCAGTDRRAARKAARSNGQHCGSRRRDHGRTDLLDEGARDPHRADGRTDEARQCARRSCG